MSLPVFPVSTQSDVRVGALAVAATASSKIPRLDLRELPAAPKPDQLRLR